MKWRELLGLPEPTPPAVAALEEAIAESESAQRDAEKTLIDWQRDFDTLRVELKLSRHPSWEELLGRNGEGRR